MLAGLVIGESLSPGWSAAHAQATSAAASRSGIDAAPPATSATARFSLPAQSLDKTLRALAQQANVNISYDPTQVAGLSAPAIQGTMSLDQALVRALRGSSLRVVHIDASTIQLVTDLRGSGSAPPPLRSDDESANLEEITVTGSHIRGSVETPSPLLVFTRAQIDATGSNTIQQFLQTITQNGGGASENTIGSVAANNGVSNAVGGSAPNLRSLGPQATLVLVNGHRVAPGNIDGSFVDVSMIPLTAVDRIEFVTDGASAIYGSDAVGGVVNIILRQHFEGLETRAQIGSVTKGGMHDAQVGNTVAHDWGSGSALLAYQYFDQTPLLASSRSYLSGAPEPFTLLPEQVSHSIFANFRQTIAGGVELHADVAYAHRATTTAFGTANGAGVTNEAGSSRIDGYAFNFGASKVFSPYATVSLLSTYSESDTRSESFETPTTLPTNLQNIEKDKATLASTEINVDGEMAGLPGGALKYALGGQFRDETFGDSYFYPPTKNVFYPSRRIWSAYAELRIPLLPNHAAERQNPLELTVADRDEHYSDFGASNNPQYGLVWTPIRGLAIRGTFANSFEAPLLSQLNPVPVAVVPIPASFFNPGPTGSRNILFIDGGNPALRPQTARSWTIGAELKATDGRGPTAKINYYHIRFSQRIDSAEDFYSPYNVLNDAAILGPGILNLEPTLAQINRLYASPSLVDYFGLAPAQIGAIFDARYLNVATLTTSGVDFGVGYKGDARFFQYEAGVDGTYIDRYTTQFANAPAASLLNTSFNPVNLRLRSRMMVTRGPLSGALFGNFVNSYEDVNAMPNRPIASWTTFDATLSYDWGHRSGALDMMSVAFAVTNLADRAPPHVTNFNAYAATYDGVNANALGRFVSLRLQKRW